MGVGKSYFGRQLADKLDIPFIDLDEEIIKAEKASIIKIFSSRGESYFREMEKKVLFSAIESAKAPAIFSLGGGTLLNPEISIKIKQFGMLACLQNCSLYAGNSRGGHRPLLVSEDRKSLYQRRVSGYSAAHICIRVDLFSVEDVVRQLIKGWKYHELEA